MQIKSQDIIIFGKNSILAKNFSSYYVNSNNNLIFLKNSKDNDKDINCSLGETLSKKKIREISSNIEKLSKFDNKVFILFSWSGRPRTSSEDYSWGINSNIINNFLSICKVVLPSKIIFISSTSIYPEKQKYFMTEKDIPKPLSKYSQQKLIAEKIFETFSKMHNLKYTILRVSSAYGFDKRFSNQGVINKWLHDSLIYGSLKLYNSHESKINFISYEQITKAIIISIERELIGIYNIASTKSTELKEIIHKVELVTNKNLKIEVINKDKRNINIDINKFFADTGIKFENKVIDNIELIYDKIKKEFN